MLLGVSHTQGRGLSVAKNFWDLLRVACIEYRETFCSAIELMWGKDLRGRPRMLGGDDLFAIANLRVCLAMPSALL